jgi:hypothetical protein
LDLPSTGKAPFWRKTSGSAFPFEEVAPPLSFRESSLLNPDLATLIRIHPIFVLYKRVSKIEINSYKTDLIVSTSLLL